MSPGQINFLLPYGTAPGSATVLLSAGLQDSTPFSIRATPVAPVVPEFATDI